MVFKFAQQVSTTTVLLYVNLCTTTVSEHCSTSMLSRYLQRSTVRTPLYNHLNSELPARGKDPCSLSLICGYMLRSTVRTYLYNYTSQEATARRKNLCSLTLFRGYMLRNAVRIPPNSHIRRISRRQGSMFSKFVE